MSMRTWFPFGLVGFRLLLAPLFIVGLLSGVPPWFYVALLLAGIGSDIFDGVLARRWGTSTPSLRRFDSNVDSVFYGLAGVTVVFIHAAYLSPWRGGLSAMFLFMIAQNVVNGIRYRRQPAYHMWSGKLWSIVLVVALVGLFLNRPCAWAIDGLIALGIYNAIEGMVASLVLAKPMTDIPTMFHAIRIASAKKTAVASILQ
jgi:phosphatidylglycerophosphate synthase